MATNDKATKTKPTTAAKSKAKPVTPTKADMPDAIVPKALARAIHVIERELGEVAGMDIEPGSYPVALSISINGDITIAKPTESQAKGKPTITSDDLVASLLAGCGNPSRYLREAVNRIKRAEGGAQQTQTDLAAARKAHKDELAACCQQAGLWEEGTPTVRRGSTGGLPAVEITGSVGKAMVSIQVSDAE